jgi:hypothetical protein
MFNAPVLDLVILLSFTYFIGSLILSAINESIAGALRLRQKDLRKGLDRFFFDPQWKGFVKTVLLKSPHIQTLMQKKDRLPAYIPAKNFVSALIENLDQVSLKEGKVVSRINGMEKEILPPDAMRVMKSIMQEVMLTVDGEMTTRIREFQSRLETLFNNTMDRVTGWYKKRVRKILFIVGFIMAIVLNIDTIKIANDALKNTGKLSNTVDNISANLAKYDSLNRTIVVTSDSLEVTTTPALEQTQDRVNQLKVVYEEDSGYKLGYQKGFRNEWGDHPIKKLIGMLITAFALQLGANYWFGLMTKAVNVRAVGKKPEENTKDDKNPN